MKKAPSMRSQNGRMDQSDVRDIPSQCTRMAGKGAGLFVPAVVVLSRLKCLGRRHGSLPRWSGSVNVLAVVLVVERRRREGAWKGVGGIIILGTPSCREKAKNFTVTPSSSYEPGGVVEAKR